MMTTIGLVLLAGLVVVVMLALVIGVSSISSGFGWWINWCFIVEPGLEALGAVLAEILNAVFDSKG